MVGSTISHYKILEELGRGSAPPPAYRIRLQDRRGGSLGCASHAAGLLYSSNQCSLAPVQVKPYFVGQNPWTGGTYECYPSCNIEHRATLELSERQSHQVEGLVAKS
jgi:hypothetical protein